MPRVPTYDNYQTTPNTLPQARLVTPDTPDIAGAQAQQSGRALTAGGQAIAKIALDMQQQANQLRIDDGLNQLKEETLRLTYDKEVGFTNLKGIDALERPGDQPLADEYSETLQSRINEISASLGNDVQRQAFTLQANDVVTSMRGQAPHASALPGCATPRLEGDYI